MRQIVLIAHNLRSCHNVGSLLRTAEGLGVQKVYLTGYTPYPSTQDDKRLPHIANRLTTQIHKTALGAENQIDWEHQEKVEEVISRLHLDGYTICALEQTPHSIPLSEYKPTNKIVILLGQEVEGIDPALLKLCEHVLEIHMFGKKESFNVIQAAAMATYHCRFAK